MILAAGLTPAWQQIMSFDRFQIGEVNRAASVHWCASGKATNVGLALHHLGAASRTLLPLGGLTGQAIQAELSSLAVNCRVIPTATATRVCTTILDFPDAATQAVVPQATELVQNATSLTQSEFDAFVSAYHEEASRATWVILTGSLPTGTPATFYRDLLRRTEGRAILDCRGEELRHALECRPFLVKPNREELAQTIGKPIPNDEALAAAMRDLRRLGAEWVVVSDGGKATWMLGPVGLFRAMPGRAAVINAIGCGDCLAAGIGWALLDGCAPVQALAIGMAAAAENIESLLPGRLRPTATRERARSIQVSRIGDP